MYAPPSLVTGWMAQIANHHQNISAPIQSAPLCMVYITGQRWGELYSIEEGFRRGTVFPELDLEFMGEGACRHA